MYVKKYEDREIIIDSYDNKKDQGYFAIYDGHGGVESVDFVSKALHLNFQHELLNNNCNNNIAKYINIDESNPYYNIHKAFINSYIKTDNQIRRQNIFRSGTTAVTCYITIDNNNNKILHTANVGDTRAILIQGTDHIAKRLTIDHKPSLPEETARIEQAGGKVIDNRVNRVLAVSRALGDHMLKHNDLVSPIPYCTSLILHPKNDKFLLLACDGVWDVLDDQKVANFVYDTYKVIYKQQLDDVDGNKDKVNINIILESVAKGIVDLSLKMNSKDNITVMIIKL